MIIYGRYIHDAAAIFAWPLNRLCVEKFGEEHTQPTDTIMMMIIIILLLKTIFMVLSSWHSCCKSSPDLRDECMHSAKWPPGADIWTKLTALSYGSRRWVTWPPKFLENKCYVKLACMQLENYIHHRSPKADAYFIIPQRIEGWVDLGGRLYIS